MQRMRPVSMSRLASHIRDGTVFVADTNNHLIRKIDVDQGTRRDDRVGRH